MKKISAFLAVVILTSFMSPAFSGEAKDIFNLDMETLNDISVPVPTLKPMPVFENNYNNHFPNTDPSMEACHSERSCFMSNLDGVDRQLCEAYKEDKSCFMALDGADRGWCEVLKEEKSCFMALDGNDRERCEKGRYPRKHTFWAYCGNINLPHNYSNPIMQACRGEISCFMALDGVDRQLCEAYKENKSCFMAGLDGADRGWCEVLNEGKSCFMSSLEGTDRERCERGYYSRKHLFWKSCGDN